MRVSELALNKSICMEVYGEAGTGKTEFIGSAGERAVIVSNRNGLLTLQGAGFKKRHPLSNPHVELVDPDRRANEAKAFEQMKKIADKWFSKDENLRQFDVFAIDDASFMKNSARNMAIMINGMSGRSKTASNISGLYKDNVLLTEADFGTEMDLTFSFIRDLTDAGRMMGKHILFGAHEAKIYIKEKKPNSNLEIPVLDQIVPAYTGKKEPTANSTHFDLIARLTREGKENSAHVRFQFISDDLVDAKDRLGVFKMYEKNLDWPLVIARITALQTPPLEVAPLVPIPSPQLS